jgi:hypothetical protein
MSEFVFILGAGASASSSACKNSWCVRASTMWGQAEYQRAFVFKDFQAPGLLKEDRRTLERLGL